MNIVLDFYYIYYISIKIIVLNLIFWHKAIVLELMCQITSYFLYQIWTRFTEELSDVSGILKNLQIDKWHKFSCIRFYEKFKGINGVFS